MENLIKLRKENNLTQQEVAKFLNIANNTYCWYEKDKTEPNIETLKKLADYYKVSVDYLIDHKTQNIIDISNFNEYKKGVLFALQKLNEKNDLILLGYITHMLAEQEK